MVQVVLVQPVEVVGGAESEVAISAMPPTVTDAGSVHVTIGLGGMPLEERDDGEILIFGGAAAERSPVNGRDNGLVF